MDSEECIVNGCKNEGVFNFRVDNTAGKICEIHKEQLAGFGFITK
jgi:hypothetical protein